MIRLRTPSIRYETGFAVATQRNQSTAIRLRGIAIDEMKRKTKNDREQALHGLARAGAQRGEEAERAEREHDERVEDEQHEQRRPARLEADAGDRPTAT